MVKIYKFCLALGLSVVALSGCGYLDTMNKDLTTYSEAMTRIVPQLNTLATKIESIGQQENPLEIAEQVKALLPVATELLKDLEKSMPQTETLQKIHQILLGATNEQVSALSEMARGIVNNDSALINDAKAKLAKAKERIQQYRDAYQAVQRGTSG